MNKNLAKLKNVAKQVTKPEEPEPAAPSAESEGPDEPVATADVGLEKDFGSFVSVHGHTVSCCCEGGGVLRAPVLWVLRSGALSGKHRAVHNQRTDLKELPAERNHEQHIDHTRW